MCTSIMAGRAATADHSILLSRNEDYTRNNWNKYMAYRAKPEYLVEGLQVVSDGRWTLGNGLVVPAPAAAYAYSAIPDAAGYLEAERAIGDRYFFEERGINENNVAISATNSLTINERAQAADPLLAGGGIAEAVIPTLILPQAASARSAVELLGAYIERYGASEVNGVLIGDPDEAWYLENGSAHHWIAVRIPDHAYLVVANGMRVHDVDLDDPGVLHSRGLFEFIVEHRLLAKPMRHSLNFAAAFGIPGVPYNEDRIWLAQKLLTPSRMQEPRQQQYPLFLQPDSHIRVRDVMNVLRATYKGTALDGIATRPIGYEKTAESHIITLDGAMPQPLKGMIWQAVSTPLGAPYMPLFATLDAIPPMYAMGSNDYGPMSAYWAFRGLHALANSQGTADADKLAHLWIDYENSCLEEMQPLKAMLSRMHRETPRAALAFSQRYSSGIAYETVALAQKKRNELMTAIAQAC